MDIDANEAKMRELSKDTPVTVFIAEPITKRLITNPRVDENPEELASRQKYLDLIFGIPLEKI